MGASNEQLLKRFRQLVEDVKMSTEVDKFETRANKEKRIKDLLSNVDKFAMYYFPIYCSAPTASFQKRACIDVIKKPNKVHLWQWSREFAKSVYANIILPSYLNFNGELTGMIVGCANEDDAILKLQDIQAWFEASERIKYDFGDQKLVGSWEDGNFALKSGVFFRGFGRKQNPRGVRFMQNRPNYGVLDDIDDKKLVKNDQLSGENYAWVKEDFMGALSTKKWRLVVAENKFHKNTITARFENDNEISVNLVRVNMLNDKGQSNWPEHFTTQECKDKIDAVGYISSQREYFNNPIEEGTVFQSEWFQFTKMLPFKQYDYLVSYTDPSYKNSDKSDYKATILMGKKGLEYHIIKAFVDKVSIRQMFEWLYDIDQFVGKDVKVLHYLEANFLQDLLFGELENLAKDKGYMLPIFHDKRSKPDKFQRIEALQPLFQRGLFKFNEKEIGNPGMLKLKTQFMAFEKGSRINDDGPDAVEGAVYVLNQKTVEAKPMILGARKHNKYKF